MTKVDTIKDVSNTDMELKLRTLKEWKTLKQQVEAKIKELETEIKEFMNSVGEKHIACGPYVCQLTEVNKSTFDKDIIREADPQLYEKASGNTTYIRLTVK